MIAINSQFKNIAYTSKMSENSLAERVQTSIGVDLNFTVLNSTICHQIEIAMNTILSTKDIFVDEVYASGIILPCIVMLISLPIAFFGARILYFVAIVAATGASFWIAFSFLETSEKIGCDARLMISSILALLAALATGCMIKLAIFMIGAVAFGSFGHLVFMSLPSDTFGEDMPEILNRPAPYWLVVLMAGLVGGLLVRYKRKVFLEACTAFIGGCGFAYGVHGISTSTGINTPRWATAVIGGTFSIVGFLFQRKTRDTKLCSKKKEVTGSNSK